MKTYLLLRNNKQTGPHTFEEMLNMGLKPHDLIWVEGKSGAWRYPTELDEFKSQVANPADIAADLPFTQVQNDVLQYMTASQADVAEDRGDELNEFPTLALFMKDKPEPRIEAQPRIEATDEAGMDALLEPVQQEEPAPAAAEARKEEAQPSRINVSLPAARTDNRLVLIHPREETVEDLQELPMASPEITSFHAEHGEITSLPAETEALLSHVAEPGEAISIDSETGSGSPSSGCSEPTAVAPVHTSAMIPQLEPVKPVRGQEVSGHERWITRVAVAAAVASLVAVAGLVAYSIFGPDPYQVSKPVQVGRTTLQKRTASGYTATAADSAHAFVASGASAIPPDPVIPEPQPALQKTSAKAKPDPRSSAIPSETAGKVIESASSAPIEPVATSAKETVPDAKSETRNNISKLVTFRMGYYKANMLGGVSAFEVVLNNGTAYPLDKVEMELEYILSNGKTYKTERIFFQEIAPGGSQTVGVPKSSRGVKVLPAIRFIESRDLDLSYRQ